MSTKRLLRRGEYTVAWLCALSRSEAVAALTMLDEEHEKLPQDDNDDNTYTYGSIKGHNIVIACMPPGQPGKVSASRLVQPLPTSFPNLRVHLFVGIGGGIPCDPPTEDATLDVHLGDVIVGWPDETGAPAVVQYDLTRNTGQVKERLSVMDKPNRRLLSALGQMLTDRVRGRDLFSSHLTKFIQAGVKGFGYPGSEEDTLYQSDYVHAGSNQCDDCDHVKVVKRESRPDPVFHQGTIASGDTVVKDARLRDEIGRQCHGAKCVEMEAAGVIDQTHCLVIRGIADYADSHKKQKWQNYAAATAAAFARELLLTIQPSAVAKMEPVQMQVNQMVENKERDRILAWLSPLNFGPRLSDMLERRQEGTGTWLLKSQLFTDWLKGNFRTLWCPGMPGAGKTILASTILDHLQQMYKNTSDVGIGWVYCIYNETGQTAHNLLASLLQQFCRQKGPLSPELSKFYEQHCRLNTRLVVSDILKLLHAEIQRFSKVYIVIDALDECPESDRTRDVFLKGLEDLPSNAYLLITSRPHSSIESRLTKAERLEISAHVDDVRRHVAARIENEPRFMERIAADPSLHETIISNLTERAQGMFLLAELNIDSLLSEPSLRHLRKALETLPKELDDTYDQAMERIQCQKRSNVDFANKILSWVIFARRPLMIEELRFALAVEPGDSDLDKEGLPDRGDLLSVCGGLVMISGDTETIRFIHYTVQEYFERARHLESSSAHTYLAATCITYLSFSNFATGQFWDHYCHDRLLVKLLDRHILLRYASEHWGDHVRECCDQDPAIHAVVRSFLTLKANVLCSIEARYDKYVSRCKDRLSPKIIFDLHVAASFGLDWLIEELLQQGASVNAEDAVRRTPLHVVAVGGYTNVVKSLLEKGANPNIRDIFGWDALELAAIAGHEPATRLLLQEALLPDMKKVFREVAGRGHLGVLRLILRTLKDTPEKATCVATALLAALYNEHEACISLLLEEVEDLEMSEIQSSLDKAVFVSLRKNNSVLTQFFLDHGADLTYGLHEAIQEGDEAVARRMLDLGANVNVSGSNKEPPLLIAVKKGCTKVVERLLEGGANISAKDGNFNRSATEWAVLKGNLHVVQLLLKNQPPAQKNEGLLALTQLYQALRYYDTNDKNVFTRLNGTAFHDRLIPYINTLKQEADEGIKRLLLLHHPASKGSESIVRAFIDMGADVEALDEEGLRALHRAAQFGHTNIIRLLLDHGAMVDPQKEGRLGITPLFLAITNRHYGCVKLLIERGADIKPASRELFMVATCWLNEDIVRLVLDSGVDPNTKSASREGGNILHRAAYVWLFIKPKILRLLVTKGADLEAKDHKGRTPLMLAVKKSAIDRVGLLLELGADPTSVEDDTMPMSYANDVDFESAMQLVKDAKQRWIEGARSKSPSPSINERRMKRRISRISD